MRELESLDAWKLANRVARDAYVLTMVKPLERHFALADQIRRAAISVPANMVEGYALGTRPQLIRHVRIAFASAAELECHLAIVHDLKLSDAKKSASVLRESDRLVRILVGYLKKPPCRGTPEILKEPCALPASPYTLPCSPFHRS